MIKQVYNQQTARMEDGGGGGEYWGNKEGVIYDLLIRHCPIDEPDSLTSSFHISTFQESR